MIKLDVKEDVGLTISIDSRHYTTFSQMILNCIEVLIPKLSLQLQHLQSKININYSWSLDSQHQSLPIDVDYLLLLLQYQIGYLFDVRNISNNNLIARLETNILNIDLETLMLGI